MYKISLLLIGLLFFTSCDNQNYSNDDKVQQVEKDGSVEMKVSVSHGDPGYIKFAIEHQGYGKIIKQCDVLH